MFSAIHYVVIILLFCFVAVTVCFNESTYSVNEGDGIVQPVLVLNSTPAIDITVHVLCTGGSAVHDIAGSAGDDADYELETHKVIFQKGTNHTTLTITIIDDTVWELNEDFTLTIDTSSLPSNVTVTKPGNTTVTILSDDGKSNLRNNFCKAL